MYPRIVFFFCVVLFLMHTVFAAGNISNHIPKVTNNCTCGRFKNEPDLWSMLRIVNGKETKTTTHPWLALLIRRGSFVCGGSVINSWYVLTAAHCLPKQYKKKDFQVMLGVHYRLIMQSGHEQRYSIASMLVHEGYEKLGKNGGLNNDIALIKLEREVSFNEYVRPICLPIIDTSLYEGAHVQGWGRTEEEGSPSISPLQATLSLMTTEKCQESNALSYLGNPATHICAQDLFADSCTGDSGGPLFVATENNTGVQIGIVSVGAFCGRVGYPAVYTKVESFLGWIYQHTPGSVFCSID